MSVVRDSLSAFNRVPRRDQALVGFGRVAARATGCASGTAWDQRRARDPGLGTREMTNEFQSSPACLLFRHVTHGDRLISGTGEACLRSAAKGIVMGIAACVVFMKGRHKTVLLFELLALVIVPSIAAWYLLHLLGRDFSIPFVYDNGDLIWQLTLTKALLDNGWILTNAYMGAPDVARWYNNSAAQTSALHSVIMWCLGQSVKDAVATQQYYYVANFALITITSYMACRLLEIRRFFAFCAGILFAFVPYRFFMIPYAFLPNFFAVPLAILLPIWVLRGEFLIEGISPLKQRASELWAVLRSPRFVGGLAIIVVTAVSDGYYAFFTLLLLGFATVLRVIAGDIRRPWSLIPPAVFMGVLVATAVLLPQPLRGYPHSHPEDFAPGGVPDTARQPAVRGGGLCFQLQAPDRAFEAAPRSGVRACGRTRLSEPATRRESIPTPQWTPLGSLGSLLFLGLLAGTVVMLVRGDSSLVDWRERGTVTTKGSTPGAIAALALFVLACSIIGGIGSLIALFYPVIRAYDRFPLFLSFLLYAGAGAVLSSATRGISGLRYAMWAGLVGVITILALFDQVPGDIIGRHQRETRDFVSERNFVRDVERALPEGAMVYHFPYSQYLTNNRYYGWGSFRHMRLYLHSRQLRWSTGASKNSPVDNLA